MSLGKVMVVGGGSAGHVTPLVAVLSELVKQHGKRRLQFFVVAEVGEDAFDPLFDEVNPKFYRIHAGKIRRFANWKWYTYVLKFHYVLLNIRDLFLVVVGFFESISLIRRLRPDVLFSKGGYVALPLGLAAAVMRVPIITHDSDARPGLSNRIVSRWARGRAVGMPSTSELFTYTGTPVRAEFNSINKASARKKLNIGVREKLIVIVGGSLGARRVNDAVLDILKKLLDRGYHVHHLGGVGDYERLRGKVKKRQLKDESHYRLYPFVNEELVDLYAAADVVVSRAGATTIAELAAVSRPTIFVPNHQLSDQEANAQLIKNHEAGYVLEENVLMADSRSLDEAIEFMLADHTRARNYAKNLHAGFYNEHAAELITEMITNAVGKDASAK